MELSYFGKNLSNLTDDDLISIINNNDENYQNAFNIIITRYIEIIRFKAISYRDANTEFDDFIQEGLIALLNAVKSYDKNASASFQTYVNICIERRFYSVYKNEKRLKQIPKEVIIPLNDEDVSVMLNSDNNPLQNIIEREEYEILLHHIKTNLSEYENKVFSYYLNGYSYSQIADKLNSTTKSINNAIQRIRKKLKKV